MGRLQGITVNIKGASALADFILTEIFDENNPYPVLLGIYWVTHMNRVINIKRRKMIFEKKSLPILVPLDPVEGSCYIEPVCDCNKNDNLDCIYKITAWE